MEGVILVICRRDSSDLQQSCTALLTSPPKEWDVAPHPTKGISIPLDSA